MVFGCFAGAAGRGFKTDCTFSLGLRKVTLEVGGFSFSKVPSSSKLHCVLAHSFVRPFARSLGRIHAASFVHLAHTLSPLFACSCACLRSLVRLSRCFACSIAWCFVSGVRAAVLCTVVLSVCF